MEKDPLLKGLADNEALFLAVKKFLLSKFALEDHAYSELQGFDNDAIGEIVRSKLDGRAKVEEAFNEILRLKTIKDNKPVFNPAR